MDRIERDRTHITARKVDNRFIHRKRINDCFAFNRENADDPIQRRNNPQEAQTRGMVSPILRDRSSTLHKLLAMLHQLRDMPVEAVSANAVESFA